MKLACLGETSALPWRRPLAPQASTSRPAESPSGFTNTDPAFCPPGWLSRRQRTISAMSASLAAALPAPNSNSAQHPTRVGPMVQRRAPRVRARAGAARSLPAGVAQNADPALLGRHVGAVPAGVHGDPPAHRPLK